MSRLTGFIDLPPAADTVAPHNYRRLGGRVLLSNDGGFSAWLEEDEYRRYLAGLAKDDSLWERLAPKGFHRQFLDFNALGAGWARLGLLSWRGPSLHTLRLRRGKQVMKLAAIRAALEHAFASPAPSLAVELHADHVGPGLEGQVLFACALAHRLAEWSGRGLELTFALEHGAPDAELVKLLKEQGAAYRRWVRLGKKPHTLDGVPGGLHGRALAVVDDGAQDAAGWMAALATAGYRSLRLQAAPGLDPAVFVAFYTQALDALLAREAQGHAPREEWALLALSRLLSAGSGGQAAFDAGLDYLTELAYDADGTVRSAFGGWAVGRAGKPTIAQLKESDLAVEALDAQEGDLQPMCFHCVYKPFCRISASRNQHEQGTVWGRTVDGAACREAMGRYDALMLRLADPEARALLEKWYF